MKKILVLLLFVSSVVTAQSVQELFNTANNFYKNGNYEKAIDFYKKIENKDSISADLFYNLGNSYYKLNKVAASIYNYEKALKINPLHEDTLNNLLFAKRLTLDNIEALPKTFLQKIEESFLQKLSYNQWAITTVFISFLGSFLFLLFYFAETPIRKRVYFITSILSFLLLIISFTITLKEYKFSKKHIEAIIFKSKTTVKNEPTLQGDDVFILHEGTKVQVLDTVDNWKKIRLADGKIGWILSNELKEL